MEQWRGKSQHELMTMEQRLRRLIVERGQEMKALLEEIIEKIDAGEYGEPSTDPLIESLKYYVRSRDTIQASIKFCGGRYGAEQKGGDGHVAG